MFLSTLFCVFIPIQARPAFLPRECLCAVNPRVLEDDDAYGPSDPYFQCGAHSHGFKWCDVMDPAMCKKSWDCDPNCDNPEDCNQEYEAKTCLGGPGRDPYSGNYDDAYPADSNVVSRGDLSGVALYNLYGEQFHKGIFWKFCNGYRCRPFKSSPYDQALLQRLSTTDVEDWPDCCELCTKAEGCLTWKFIHDKNLASSRCELYAAPDKRASQSGIQPFDEQSWWLAREADTIFEVWGARGYDDMPVKCGRNSLGICHPDLWIIASFAIAFGAVQFFLFFLIARMVKHRLQLNKFLASDNAYFTKGQMYGLNKWESRHEYHDKHGTHISYITRYRSRIEYKDHNGGSQQCDWSSKDREMIHEGGKMYDAALAAKAHNAAPSTAGGGLTTARSELPIVVDKRDPQRFVVGGTSIGGLLGGLLWLGSPLGLGFTIAAGLIKLQKGGADGTQEAMDHTAIDFEARDKALEIPGVATWEENFVDSYDGTNWAAFYTDTGKNLAIPLLAIGVVVYLFSFIAAFLLYRHEKSIENLLSAPFTGAGKSADQVVSCMVDVSIADPIWEYQDSGGMFKPFGNDCQKYIEQTYQEFKSGNKGPKRKVKTGGKQIQIDFNTMQDSDQRKIRRN